MDYDGYQLYELLKDGEATTLTHEGETYTLKFVGQKTGSDNYLLVRDCRGEEKRFGWGWSVEQAWHALHHLEQGWNSTQRPPYRPYDESEEEEGGLAY
jgi:hypothetical protein